MQRPTSRKGKFYVLITTSICILASTALAQVIGQSPTAKKEEVSSIAQKEARLYRQQGLEFQNQGRIDEAISSYQKAIVMDSYYIEPYNDLGIMYEIKGLKNEAIATYQRALELDPDYLPTYSNLAYIYEEIGDLETAAVYWKERIKRGSPDDYWTQKAQEHLEDISLVVDDIALELKEQEIMNLIEKVKTDRFHTDLSLQELDEKKQEAISYLNKARVNFLRGNFSAALNNAGIAKHFDPSNTQIDTLIEEIHNRLRETNSH